GQCYENDCGYFSFANKLIICAYLPSRLECPRRLDERSVKDEVAAAM
ncbi:hypothetical protein NFI96_014075, partial [Prochilodus magdalenae]